MYVMATEDWVDKQKTGSFMNGCTDGQTDE